ncbi:hypothetical protein BDBG_17521 [Blastomyces gilchristii SLH14081]|uniref:Uncharacterized protein n=2 Tax=Blastomyces TaxID=229219 RepID=A0A179UWH2_BLAGS|nr:uncharacterized protein BDBG_17521 [Blastomyces gilchristii SLH14081]OAT11437.1 hypothetical protein BDBG_17521 [Blastomyces gilchristii SLH14081]
MSAGRDPLQSGVATAQKHHASSPTETCSIADSEESRSGMSDTGNNPESNPGGTANYEAQALHPTCFILQPPPLPAEACPVADSNDPDNGQESDADAYRPPVQTPT